MTYELPSSGEIASGTSPASATYTKWNNSIGHIASHTKGNTTLADLSASTELQDPDYDSGWFSVAASNTYDKAHSLTVGGSGVRPRITVLWFSSSLTPADGDFLEIIRDQAYGNLQVNTTYVRVVTAAQINRAGATNGYFRIMSWL